MIFNTTMAVLLGAVLMAPAAWAAGGGAIAGFEREKCMIWNNRAGAEGACVDRSDIPLMWGNASARQLAGSS